MSVEDEEILRSPGDTEPFRVRYTRTRGEVVAIRPNGEELRARRILIDYAALAKLQTISRNARHFIARVNRRAGEEPRRGGES